MEVDGHRISRVLRKITKGLFYIHGEQPLPLDCEVYVEPRITPKEFYEAAEIFKLCCHTGPQMRGEDVFWHFGIRDPVNTTTTLWLMVFYERIACLTITAERTVRHIGMKDPNQDRPLVGIDLDPSGEQ